MLSLPFPIRRLLGLALDVCGEHRRSRHGDRHHVVSEGADRGLQDGVREGQSGHQARDPEQEHGCRHRLRARNRAGTAPEIFWASAPDAFEVLKRDKLLVAAADVDNKAIPAQDRQLSDQRSQGFYNGQALAGYGIMYNTRYLKANKLPAPKEWADLLKPRVVRPRRDDRAVALGHDAPDGRDDPAGRRLGQGLGPDPRRWPATARRSPSAASACPTASTTASSASAW